ncbi:hypothetical protein Sjap_013198 [Stephania japonica]|uniref:Uncharacterized protein n=1 Tax=Stephania japonica TaxID=461633 RepID=A0AAP0P131_9MAGN
MGNGPNRRKAVGAGGGKHTEKSPTYADAKRGAGDREVSLSCTQWGRREGLWHPPHTTGAKSISALRRKDVVGYNTPRRCPRRLGQRPVTPGRGNATEGKTSRRLGGVVIQKIPNFLWDIWKELRPSRGTGAVRDAMHHFTNDVDHVQTRVADKLTLLMTSSRYLGHGAAHEVALFIKSIFHFLSKTSGIS